MDIIYFFIGFFLASIIAISIKLFELTNMSRETNGFAADEISKTNRTVNEIVDKVNQMSNKIPMSVNEVGRLD